MVIEQTIGQVKQKFPCLVYGLRVHPKKCCRIIMACCVLYNISKSLGERRHEDVEENIEDVPVPPVNDGHGLLYRDLFAQQNFT